MTNTVERLLQAIRARDFRVGIIGLGYVGLPLAKAFSEKGFRVLGFDVDERRTEQLNQGQSYIHHIGPETVRSLVGSGRFAATVDFSRLPEVDAILICVPTPLTRHREPDISYIEATTAVVAKHLRKGQLVVLESTTYPGTTREVMRPIFEARGLRSDEDFFLAFSPEREDPGNPRYSTASIPKVVGGEGPGALELAAALYGEVVAGIVRVSSSDTAEAVKLTENIFRAVNIALVNELKVVYERMGIDVWEVIDAAKTKPFGYMPFYPGPGLGGHCIPIDPFYLTWRAREYDVATRFIELAGEINTAMPAHVVEHLGEALNAHQAKALKGARILLIGLAYKRNVDDTRESPAFRLIELIERRGATVEYFDPFVPEIPKTREHAEYAGRRSVGWDAKTVAGFDAALICTDHDGVDYRVLVENCPLVVDTRNALKNITGRTRAVIVKA
jgi:UDP-N-acetyl-D-glucosamine dehydrogenase